ncbi:MAG: universal stress protein [Planctomycetia bacterium]|nr:universal stress protein [Planctomycetia bacterium]
MNARKILFPTDFSHLSDAALAHATALARDTGAMLLIVHVEEPPMAYGGGEMYYGIPEPDRAEVRRMTEAVRPTDPLVRFEHRMVEGSPAEEIVRVAEEEHVDMIVIGTHGRTGLKRLLMGSTAESVMRHAKCPVFVFKTAEHTAAAKAP